MFEENRYLRVDNDLLLGHLAADWYVPLADSVAVFAADDHVRLRSSRVELGSASNDRCRRIYRLARGVQMRQALL